MREHEARLNALKRNRLHAYPCMRAKTLAQALHGEGHPSEEKVLKWWRGGNLIGMIGKGGALFPWFQVDIQQGRIHSTVAKALNFFDEAERTSGWPVFLWLVVQRLLRTFFEAVADLVVRHSPA